MPESKKPFYKRTWVIILAVILLLVVIVSAVSSSSEDETAPQATPSAGTSVGPQGSTPPAPPAQDDPLSDDNWTLSDVVMGDNPYVSSATARVVNNDNSTRTAPLTLTAFVAGEVVGSASGFVTDAEAGSTSTVEFFFTEKLPDDDLTYELQASF